MEYYIQRPSVLTIRVFQYARHVKAHYFVGFGLDYLWPTGPQKRTGEHGAMRHAPWNPTPIQPLILLPLPPLNTDTTADGAFTLAGSSQRATTPPATEVDTTNTPDTPGPENPNPKGKPKTRSAKGKSKDE